MPPQNGDSPEPILPPSGERRRKPRFAMQCSIFLRTRHASGQWILSETDNVSTVGAHFASNVELPPDESVEYVLTFPPELTHAPAPWRVRFYGSVVRVEPQTTGHGAYGVAVHTTKHRYLSSEEPDEFCSLEPHRL
jgi:PilZ domain